ncbi:acetyl-CoA acetyltransferase [Paenibacillus thiaminolyticus]|uniref:acetyl-CoA acetyltransferase n=1 Tax=Paenibacillus thiaminolyticus TaxID=49283 RepID=UPI0011635FBC|nr:acetyl-CoA acetyltransferase [Paenibacillus thiaminolyticus]NGP61123.1 acetyl-CoA acetyltransferase [Paenibacillus thiaminolyticus]
MYQSYSAHHSSSPHQQAIYQAEPSTVQTLHSIRARVQYVGHMYKKRYVRIQTIDGHVYDGVIVNVDQGFLYLHTRMPMERRAFPGSASYSDVILPLVLYQLLVISLLYT